MCVPGKLCPNHTLQLAYVRKPCLNYADSQDVSVEVMHLATALISTQTAWNRFTYPQRPAQLQERDVQQQKFDRTGEAQA